MNEKKFQIKVTDGKYIAARKHRLRLATLGLNKVKGKSGVYRGQVSSEAQVHRVKLFCEKKGLTFSIDNKLSRRSSDYRKQFFKQNKPALIHIWYFCAYCGRPIRKKYVTVDHLVPVAIAKNSLRVQKWLARFGINNINDCRNLAPSCLICNQKKGNKTGIWLIRGCIGRHQYLWYLRWLIRICVCFMIISQVWPYIDPYYQYVAVHFHPMEWWQCWSKKIEEVIPVMFGYQGY